MKNITKYCGKSRNVVGISLHSESNKVNKKDYLHLNPLFKLCRQSENAREANKILL